MRRSKRILSPLCRRNSSDLVLGVYDMIFFFFFFCVCMRFAQFVYLIACYVLYDIL